ncbi:MAG: hypothetical protein WDW20_05455 [Neisseriaceae bacterium]
MDWLKRITQGLFDSGIAALYTSCMSFVLGIFVTSVTLYLTVQGILTLSSS